MSSTLPPIAQQIPHTTTLFGDTRTDEYHWLQQKDDPHVMAYLNAENAYTEQQLAPIKDFQQTIYDEIISHIKQTDETVPYLRQGYYYYTRTEQGKAYRIYCRKKAHLDADEEVILDVNELAQGHAQYVVSQVKVNSRNVLGYAVDLTGGHLNTVYFKDLNTGQMLPDVLPDIAQYSFGSHDSSLLYTTYDAALRPHQLHTYCLGDAASSGLLYAESDERFSLHIELSTSRRYWYVYAQSKTTTEVRHLLAHLGRIAATDLQVFNPRQQGLEYYVADTDAYFWVLTNLDAQNFKLMQTPLNATQVAHWQGYLPHRPEVLLENMLTFDRFLVLQERSLGISRFRVLAFDGSADYYIPTRDPIYAIQIAENYDSHTQLFRFQYTSLTTPESVYVIDMDTQEQTLLKQREVPGGFDAANYQSERLWATATDGTQIPISVVYHRQYPPQADSALLLYGYGSYGHSIDPTFMSTILPLLDRGVVYAIAHIRGGQELGRAWYDNGKLLHKKNTFTDFIACADHLVQQSYTHYSKLVLRGGSAGGLLLGAVLNMRPDICHIACVLVPFVDTLNTMLDDSLPLTVGEYEEWGNPNEQPYYSYIRSYSPYDNITPQAYPNILVIAGLHDTNVSYWEAAKWVARLRQHKTDQSLLMLKINMAAGHSGASSRYEAIRDIAYEYGFVLHQLGLVER